MEIKVVILIAIIHWVADFVLQTEKQALGKSKNWTDLLNHTLIYSFVWLFIGGVIYMQDFKPDGGGLSDWGKRNTPLGLLFVIITFICHTITDYFTSRITNDRYKKSHFYGFNGFWFWIGLDQVFHFIQLTLTYWFLFCSNI